MDQLNRLHRDVKLIKTARSVYKAAHLCSMGAVLIVSAVVFFDVLSRLKK